MMMGLRDGRYSGSTVSTRWWVDLLISDRFHDMFFVHSVLLLMERQRYDEDAQESIYR